MQAGSGSENLKKKKNNAHTQKPIHARAARSHPSLLFLLFFLHQPPYWMSKLSVTVLFRRQIRHRFLLQVAFEALMSVFIFQCPQLCHLTFDDSVTLTEAMKTEEDKHESR